MMLSTGKYYITKVEKSGEFITLNNGSRLKVSTFDKLTTMLWLPMTNVTVDSISWKTVKITNPQEKKTIETTLVS